MIKRGLIIDKERKTFALRLSMFVVFYLTSFFLLENRVVPINLVMSEIDKAIPFCEWFIIPYLLWFPWLLITAGYFIFFVKDTNETRKLLYSFIAGTSVFLAVSLFFPNGHNLRPQLTVSNNLLMDAVKILYSVDTATNVFPSMHVFCTVVMVIAWLRQDFIKQNIWAKSFVILLSVGIVLATMCLKQHSIIDVAGALILNCICYELLYGKKVLD